MTYTSTDHILVCTATAHLNAAKAYTQDAACDVDPRVAVNSVDAAPKCSKHWSVIQNWSADLPYYETDASECGLQRRMLETCDRNKYVHKPARSDQIAYLTLLHSLLMGSPSSHKCSCIHSQKDRECIARHCLGAAAHTQAHATAT